MLKKVLTTALFGASVLGVAAANAAAPGVYVTGQIGYAKTHIKDKLTPDYQGLGNNNGLAGRLAIGYQLNQNFAVELGYLRLSSKKADVDLDGMEKIQGYSLEGGKLKAKLAQHAIDLAAKGIVPISNNFNVYGKLGIAYLTTDISGKGNAKKAADANYTPTQFNVNDEAGIKKRQWAPEAAIGVSYDITPNVALDTSWTHIHPIGKNRASNINFASVGISYNFG